MKLLFFHESRKGVTTMSPELRVRTFRSAPPRHLAVVRPTVVGVVGVVEGCILEVPRRKTLRRLRP